MMLFNQLVSYNFFRTILDPKDDNLKNYIFLKYYPIIQLHASYFLEIALIPFVREHAGFHYYEFPKKSEIILFSPCCPIDQATTSQEQFLQRIENQISWSLGQDFEWNHILLAGGSVLYALDANPNEKQYLNSDLDLYIYSDDNKVIKKKLEYVFHYLLIRFGDKLVAYYLDSYSNRTKYMNDVSMIIFLIPDKPMIQLIFQFADDSRDYPWEEPWRKKINILNEFDLTHCQIGFDGSNVIYTSEFQKTISSRVSKFTLRQSVYLYRITKTLFRGFHIHFSSQDFVRKLDDQTCTDIYLNREEMIEGIRYLFDHPEIYSAQNCLLDPNENGTVQITDDFIREMWS